MVGSRGRVELMQFPLRPSPRESTEAMVRNIPIDWHLAGPPADQQQGATPEPADRVGPQAAL